MSIYYQLATQFPQHLRHINYDVLIDEARRRYGFDIGGQYLSAPQVIGGEGIVQATSDGRYYKTIYDFRTDVPHMIYTSTNAICESDSNDITRGQLAIWCAIKTKTDLIFPYMRGLSMLCQFEKMFDQYCSMVNKEGKLTTRKGMRFGRDAYYTTGRVGEYMIPTVYGGSEEQSRNRACAHLLAQAQEAGEKYTLKPDITWMAYDDAIVQQTYEWFMGLEETIPKLVGPFRVIRMNGKDIPVVVTSSNANYVLENPGGGEVRIMTGNEVRYHTAIHETMGLSNDVFGATVKLGEKKVFSIRVMRSSVEYILYYIPVQLKFADRFPEGLGSYTLQPFPIFPIGDVTQFFTDVTYGSAKGNFKIGLRDVYGVCENVVRYPIGGFRTSYCKERIEEYRKFIDKSNMMDVDSLYKKYFGGDIVIREHLDLNKSYTRERVMALKKILGTPLNARAIISKYNCLPIYGTEIPGVNRPGMVICLEDCIMYRMKLERDVLHVDQVLYDGIEFVGCGLRGGIDLILGQFGVITNSFKDIMSPLCEELVEIIGDGKTVIEIMGDIRKRMDPGVSRGSVVEALHWMIKRDKIMLIDINGKKYYGRKGSNVESISNYSCSADVVKVEKET